MIKLQRMAVENTVAIASLLVFNVAFNDWLLLFWCFFL